MADLRWFRLEIGPSGKVVSCVAVEHAERDGTSWFYVQAVDSAHAGRLALNAYARELQRRRVKRLTAEGKCQCGRKNDRPGKSRCSVCAARRPSDDARRRARSRGEDIPRPDRRIADAARRQAETATVVAAVAPSLRLDVLLEVQQAWRDAATNSAFTAWLARQIEAAGGKRRAS